MNFGCLFSGRHTRLHILAVNLGCLASCHPYSELRSSEPVAPVLYLFCLRGICRNSELPGEPLHLLQHEDSTGASCRFWWGGGEQRRERRCEIYLRWCC